MIENFVFLKNIADNTQTTKQYSLENKQIIWQFCITKKKCLILKTMVKTQVASSKVNILFEVIQFQHRI